MSRSPAVTLIAEFAGRLPAEAVERAVAAARHALERGRFVATLADIEELARDHLHRRLALSNRRHHAR